MKNPTPKKKTKPKNKADERQRGERWSEAETAACMLSAIRNRGELKAKIPMGGKSAQQVKDEAYQKVLCKYQIPPPPQKKNLINRPNPKSTFHNFHHVTASSPKGKFS